MKRLCYRVALAMCFLWILTTPALAAAYLIPGGQVVGLQLQNGSVTVAAFDDALGAGAREAGLKIGDQICEIDGMPITCAQDVRRALARQTGEISLCVRRNGKERTVCMVPQSTADGPRLGIHLKQGITGIGTVTWYDPATGRFGTLGHGVSQTGGGLLAMTGGEAFRAQVVGVKKGKCGDPGVLKGCADGVCGRLTDNTPQGVFGITDTGWQGNALPAADYADVHTGKAAIRSTVAGDRVQEYSVEILKIYPRERTDGRNFLLRVTDPELLEATGGIVQGMSGSPILQDGKLVGAVTHVLINEPAAGYGIFIENMLEAAGG